MRTKTSILMAIAMAAGVGLTCRGVALDLRSLPGKAGAARSRMAGRAEASAA